MGRVVVLGALTVDEVTVVERHPRPGETIVGVPAGRRAGGKGGNQALAARRAGAEVVLIGRVGADGAGTAYLERLRRHGIHLEVPTCADAPTGTAHVTVDERGASTRVIVPGANEWVPDDAVAAARVGPGDVLLCSLEVPAATVARAAARAHRAGARVVINLAPHASLAPDVVALADPVVVNEAGMLQLADSDLVPTSLLVTFGAAGARWGADEVSGIRVPRPEVADEEGAGDAFCGALAAALVRRADNHTALRAANEAGAAAVRWAGAQPDSAL